MRGLSSRQILFRQPRGARLYDLSLNTVLTTPRVDTPLTVIAEIAAILARGPLADAAVRDVLQALRRAIRADEASIWRRSPAGLECSSRVGSSESSAADVDASISAGGSAGGLLAVPVRFGAGDVAVLCVRRSRVTPEQFELVAVVADLLSAPFAQCECSQQLGAGRAAAQQVASRFLQKIVDSLPLGLYVIDREYRIQAWNRKRETGMQGVSREEAIGRTIFEILYRRPAGMLRREFDEVFQTGKVQVHEIDNLTNGLVRSYRITKIPMRMDDAEVSHVITIGEDITDWKRAQERIGQAEKLAAMGQLAAGVMHEINNPMATIGVCAEGIAMRLDDLASDPSARAAIDDYVRIVEGEVHRCKRIIDRLLDFSRPSGTVKSHLDANAVMETTLFLLKHHARFRRMEVERDYDRGNGAWVDGSADSLVQAFMAILLNATDAMDGGGTIVIRTRSDETEASIEIVDQGCGISRIDLPKLFEPFYTTKEPGRGTGLGLAICYGIISDHRGRIEVDSAVGQGSTFRIILPRARAVAAA